MADRSSGYRQHLRFSLMLHRVLSEGRSNSCFSPYSIASALGLACQAARGSTAEQLQQLLCPEDPDVAKQQELLRNAATLEVDKHGEEAIFAVSNALWVWDGLGVNDAFRTDLAGWPGAALKQAPFVTDPEGARREINADVADTTRDLIQELIPAGAVDEQTVASLINAIYLKAAWRKRFANRDTADRQFHCPDRTRLVPTMRQVERLPYAEARGWQSVTLPATGGVEAVVLLANDGPTAAEEKPDEETVDALLSGRAKRRVALTMPRLDLAMNASLVDSLRHLGVDELFTKSADLSGLSADPRLMISDVVHESVLRLDEQGLEGAAATAAMVQLTAVDTDTPIEVRVDRPFLLLIRHATSGAVYFLAQVSDPS